jgi:D-threo-aldose 1-dehydrogenase
MSRPESQSNISVEEPLSREAFFALNPPANGVAAVPRLALGTARCGDAVEGPRLEEAVAMLREVWSEGFLLTDSAPLYDNAENVIGAALRGWGGRDPVLATKCGVETGRVKIDFSRSSIRDMVERSERRFGRRIDLLAAHEPETCPPAMAQACIDALAELRQEGRIAAAGMGGGGFEVQRQWLGSGVFGYVMTYLRINAVTLQGLADLVPLCRRLKVKIWAASPLAMGMLGDGHEPYVQRLQRGELSPKEQVFVRRAQQVTQIAAEAGLPLSQLATRFLLSMPRVDYVVLGAGTPGQWRDCLTAYRAGPLPVDLYQRLWRAAQEGVESVWGG